MPKLKLTYFDFHGGRGEPARLAMYIGKVPFEDDRIPMPKFAQLKASGVLPFGSLPVLSVDGVTVSQSVAINRYVGGLAGLYPKDPIQALFCDELLEGLEDIGARIGATIGIPDREQLKATREKLAEGPLKTFLLGFDGILKKRGGEFFVDNRLTVADLAMFGWVKWLQSGTLDFIPAEIVKNFAPAVARHYSMMCSHPGVAAYYSERSVKLPVIS